MGKPEAVRAVCHAFLAAALLLSASLPGAAETVSGTASVIDGDTLEVADRSIRLHGIDAAETGQRCAAPGRKIARPSNGAIDRLRQLVAGGVVCNGSESDDYGRLIAICTNGAGKAINRLMVREGHAWAFVKFSSDYVNEEKAARDAGLNIWSMRCQEPWVFRATRWTKNATKSPEGCAIKGNISGNGRIYHMPWNNAYAKTVVDTSKGELWFCDEAEAQAAGWRPARN